MDGGRNLDSKALRETRQIYPQGKLLDGRVNTQAHTYAGKDGLVDRQTAHR